MFTSENHLNAHSFLIKPHMAINFAPLDCSCQGASSEPKKICRDISALEKFAKKQKIHIFGSHSKKLVQWAELFTIPEFNSFYSITDSNLVRIGDKKFLEENMYSPLLSNFHFGKSFKRP
jgi:hypothetical protein